MTQTHRSKIHRYQKRCDRVLDDAAIGHLDVTVRRRVDGIHDGLDVKDVTDGRSLFVGQPEFALVWIRGYVAGMLA